MDERIAVVGGGLAGALMAAYLGKRGYEVDVLELRPDPRTAEAARGRSINLAISTRGIRALARAGIVDEVLAEAVPMYGRMLHDERGGLRFQRYGRQGQAINSVSRNGLNCKLIEAAERLGNVRFHFASKLERIDLFEGRLSIAGGSEIQAAAVIGADGAFSAVRREMQRQDRFDFSQNYLAHGYKELTIPPAEGGGFRMEPNALHIWPRGGFMMIALPNYDGSYTGTLFWPFDGSGGLTSLTTADSVKQYFATHFPDAIDLIPNLCSEYLDNPNSSLVTVRCSPWHWGRAVLLGDAAHAVVPFYGQGANAAFEDCVVLDDLIASNRGDLPAAFSDFSQARKSNVDILADLALANFVEMRDKVTSPAFRIRKSLGRLLHSIVPFYRPLYSMVTFSNLGYAAAIRRARLQARLLRNGAAALIALVAYVLLRLFEVI